jgi:MFS-type transporter involved in bile tolerance (Atg22 family)
VGKEKIMVLGYGVFLISLILIFMLPLNGLDALLVAVFYGAYFGIIETVQRALVPKYVDRNLVGTAYGIYYLVVGSALFVSNAVVGSLWDYIGSSTAATYSIITSTIAIVFMILFIRRTK